jgi:hypothetical protein
MINWSPNTLKVTLGIGALFTTALLGELSHQKISVWVALTINMGPFCIFLFATPGEMRRSIVLSLQVLASLWYLLLAACLAILFFVRGEKIPGWPFLFVGIFPGCVPCLVVLWKALSLRNDEQGRETEA